MILFRGKSRYNGQYVEMGEIINGSLITKMSGVFIYLIDTDELQNVIREIEVEIFPGSVQIKTDSGNWIPVTEAAVLKK